MGHPRHFPQDVFRVVHGLQGLGQHHRIELFVVEQRQAFFQVLLDHAHPAPHGRDHALVVQFDARPTHLAGPLQVIQQPAIAAAQIQHPAARLDPLGNPQQVDAQRLVRVRCSRKRHRRSCGRHARTPATRRRSPRPRRAAMPS